MNSLLQDKLFKHILSQCKTTVQAVEGLQTLLSISQASVYKRINGTILIRIDEFEKLIKHYQLSSDELMETTGSKVTFDFAPLISRTMVKGSYLNQMIKDLQKVEDDPKGKVIYISTGIPFFYYFLQKEVAWFKLYHFQTSESNLSISELPKITFSDIGLKEEKIFNKIITTYSLLDSEEVWTSRAFRITVDEILYFAHAGLFQNIEDALMLMDKLLLLATQLLSIVQSNNKGLMLHQGAKGGRLKLYYNDFNRFNPTIITQTSSETNLYLTYDLPNFLNTSNAKFTKYSLSWLNKIKKKSHLLSGNSELEQTRFFNKIRQYISNGKKQIRKSIKEF